MEIFILIIIFIYIAISYISKIKNNPPQDDLLEIMKDINENKAYLDKFDKKHKLWLYLRDELNDSVETNNYNKTIRIADKILLLADKNPNLGIAKNIIERTKVNAKNDLLDSKIEGGDE